MAAPNREPPAGLSRPGWRNRGAVFLGKALIESTRMLKQGGTTLPGRAALKVSPQLISFLSRQLAGDTVAITGTNGKTTTAALLAATFKQAGRDCVHNAAGANLSWGIATTLIEAATWKAELAPQNAVLEIDEGAFPALSKSLRPRTAVVTNIFRDQLDRFGGTWQVRKAIQEGLQALPPGALLLLNADDPLVASLGGGAAETLYYGLELPPPASTAPAAPKKPEVPCPRCDQKLLYSRLYFAHLGRYRCPSCGFIRPEPGFKLRPAASFGKNGALQLILQGRALEAALPLPGVYNLYNALAAAAAASACGLPDAAIMKALSAAAPPAGRMEQHRIGSKNLLTALVKNPAGTDAVLRTLAAETRADPVHFLIAINDRPADGTDSSWLWEADFEQLAALRPRPGSVILSGTKAGEVKLRLEKAGFDRAGLTAVLSLPGAFRKAVAATAPGEKLIILANYTAMRQLRRLIDRNPLPPPTSHL